MSSFGGRHWTGRNHLKKYWPKILIALACGLFACFSFFLLLAYLPLEGISDQSWIDFLMMAIVIYPGGILEMLGVGEPFVSSSIVLPFLNLAGAALLYLAPALFFALTARRLRRRATGEQVHAPALIKLYEILNSILLIVGVPLCYGFLTIYGIAFIGAGHGSDFFGSLALSPFTADNSIKGALVFWPVFAWLLAYRRVELCRRAALFLLLIHYMGVVWLSIVTEWGYVFRVVDSLFWPVALHMSLYIGSQIFFWKLLRKDSDQVEVVSEVFPSA